MPPKKKQSVRSNRICFTLNNFTEEEECLIRDFSKQDYVQYMIVGSELAPNTGTKHLQGFVHLKQSFLKAKDGNVSKWKSLCPGLQRAHLESAFGTDSHSKTYCSKESVLIEVGTVEDNPQSIWATLVRCKTMEEARDLCPESYLKFHSQLKSITALNQECPDIAPRLLKDWQISVINRLMKQDPRQVLFVVDEVGNAGKSELTKFLLCRFNAFVSTGGKVCDLMHIHSKKKYEYAVFDMARCNNPDFYPWGFIEMLKNGWYQTTKYDGQTVVCGVQKVVMFMNQMPNLYKLSNDRYDIFVINEDMRTQVPNKEFIS